jgi:hypothetical protein
MNRYVAALLVVLGVVGVVGVLAVGRGFADDENASRAKCSEATLHGTYLFAYDGVDVTGTKQVPFAIAGYDVFDGNGHAKTVFSVNFDGHIIRKIPSPARIRSRRIAQAPPTGSSICSSPQTAASSRSSRSNPAGRWRQGLICRGRPSGLPHRRRSSSLARGRAGAFGLRLFRVLGRRR